MRMLYLFLRFGMFWSFFFLPASAWSQIEVWVRVEEGVASTTCTDPTDGPDILWAVSIAGQNEVIYPKQGSCFSGFPFVQYRDTFSCPADLPTRLQVCYNVFENDADPLVACNIVKTCNESVCGDFTIPSPGDSSRFTLNLPAGGSSGGRLTFTIFTTVVGPGLNDGICGAIDLGDLAGSDTLGNNRQGLYDNRCGSNTGDPNPFISGYWWNNAGVWFSFTTGDDPENLVLVEALSDPERTGDPLDLNLAVYSSSNGSCNGRLTLVRARSDNSSFNNKLWLPCLKPRTRYFILVDGASNSPGLEKGVFGLQLVKSSVVEAADERCDAEDLGIVPESGSVSVPSPRSNFCATSVRDPLAATFQTQVSVWFSFVAPSSGHVLIEGLGQIGDYPPLGVQLALYSSSNGRCNGFFQEIASIYTAEDLDERLEVSCLFPGQRYWIMIDGYGSGGVGVFDLSVQDAGPIPPPTTVIDTVICAGESIVVGSSVYSQTGTYEDTFPLLRSCDSIVITNLVVLDELEITFNQTALAVGEGNANGKAEVNITGGSGNYTIEWCNGETGQVAGRLVGGTTCCVTVTDDLGCGKTACFFVDYRTVILPSFENDSLDCFADQDGILRFSVSNGKPPYQFSWQQESDPFQGGAGMIGADGEEVAIPGLPAGTYHVSVSDPKGDTSFTVVIFQPEPLTVETVVVQDASCFGSCDGTIEVLAAGGTGSYRYQWSAGLPSLAGPFNLCAGAYDLTVVDANGCKAGLSAEVLQPAAFIATPTVEKQVSCFQGSDGQALVETNGNPIQYQWSHGGNANRATDLPAGTYSITVTNEDGCEAFASLVIEQPAAPVSVAVEVVDAIRCFGDSNGALRAVAGGPGKSFSYSWNTGASTETINGLPTGTYEIIIANENGCEASASFTLDQPDEIFATITPRNLTCRDELNGGAIRIELVTGGIPGYEFSLDGVIFRKEPLFSKLFEGAYEVVIRDEAGCERIFPVAVSGPPDLTVSLGEDRLIQLGEVIDLEALVNSDDVVFTWKPVSDTVTSGPVLSVRPVRTTLFNVEVMDTLTYCIARDDVRITVRKDRKIFIPNAFSPDLDGRNDQLMIFGGLGVEEIKSFRIFSRTGALLFERQNFQPNDLQFSWDGTYQGKVLNAGVYVYMAEISFIDGVTEVLKGDVLLVR